MKKNTNIDLRILKGNISLKEIAEQVGVTERTMITWFGSDMDVVRRTRVVNAIEELQKREKVT